MYRLVVCLGWGLCLLGGALPYPRPGKVTPVVFIPGNGGSRIEARLDRPDAKEHCEKKSDWSTLWMNVWLFIMGKLDCWVDNFRLHYNVTTRQSGNSPGVETRVPGWGDTYSVEYLDTSWAAWLLGNIGIYAAPLFNRFVTWGYTRGVNLRGAPYDFRYAPHSQPHYFESLKDLIEETYRMNGDTRVSLLSHSMGGIFAAYFLKKQTQEWKDTYVHSLVSLGTPWFGTVIIPQVYISGYVWGVKAVDPWSLREEQRSQETAAILLPKRPGWRPDDVIVRTTEKNYTISNYNEFLEDVEYPIAKLMLEDSNIPDYELTDPGVRFFCVYSRGIPTPEELHYKRGLTEQKHPTRTLMGDGDGTVNLRSLEGCRHFMDLEAEFNGEEQRVLEIHDSSHNEIFRNAEVLDFLHDLLTRSEN